MAPRRRTPIDEPWLDTLLALIFFGHVHLRDVWSRANHLSVCTMRHILWWIFYGALVIGGVLMYALNIITIGKSDSASSRVHGHITLLAKTTCLCLCLIFGVLYIQRARKRDTGAADEMSSAVRPDNASTAAIVPSGPFAPSDSSSVPTMSQALLAPALRSPPFTLYMDNLMASLPLDSSRIRKQWSRRLGWSSALVLLIFLSFLALEILQRFVSPIGSGSDQLSSSTVVICNIIYTMFLALLYAVTAAVVGTHAMSCMHLELALDSMRERLRRVSPASSQLSAALSAPGHDDGDEQDDDEAEYHALVDASGRVVSSAPESVDAIGMSHPFASVDIRAVRKAMALKHGTTPPANNTSASWSPTESFSVNGAVRIQVQESDMPSRPATFSPSAHGANGGGGTSSNPTSAVFSFAPKYTGNGRDETGAPLEVLDSVSMDLVHFHKALRRHNKTWGRLVSVVLLVFSLLLILNAFWTLSGHKKHEPVPTPHPNATFSFDATTPTPTPDPTVVDVAMYKNIAVALLTLCILIPAIVLPPSLVAGGVKELLVTMYIFADDWAASHGTMSTTAVVPSALSADARVAPPSAEIVSTPVTAASNDLIVTKITALMSRVSSLISVDALNARIASISISHSVAGGVLYMLFATALVLVPELISDSPFSH